MRRVAPRCETRERKEATMPKVSKKDANHQVHGPVEEWRGDVEGTVSEAIARNMRKMQGA